MNNRKRQCVLYLLFLCVCLCSCEKEKLPADAKQLRIELVMPEPIHVDTKTDATLDNIPVANVWIVQFARTGEFSGKCLKALYVPQAFIKQEGTNKQNLVVNLATGGDDKKTQFKNADSRFYVIANGGTNLFSSLLDASTAAIAEELHVLDETSLSKITEGKLQGVTVKIGNDSSPLVSSTSPYLLTSEPFEFTPEEDGVIKIRAQMFRAFARVELKVSFVGDGSFTLNLGSGSQTVKVYNLPKYMALYRAGGQGNTAYPAVEDISTGASNLSIDDLNTGTKSTSATFYMAENLRGIGSSSTQQGKNQAANGPGGTLNGCTYIELEGIYKYNASHTAGVKVKYTFYLGGNFTNDYNIARDYAYELTLKIAGPNSADLRVKITDGNVAVFDEVTVIPEITVEF